MGFEAHGQFDDKRAFFDEQIEEGNKKSRPDKDGLSCCGAPIPSGADESGSVSPRSSHTVFGKRVVTDSLTTGPSDDKESRVCCWF